MIEQLESRRLLATIFEGEWFNDSTVISTPGNEGWSYTKSWSDNGDSQDFTGWDGGPDDFTDHADVSFSRYFDDNTDTNASVTVHWSADWYPDQTFDDLAYSQDVQVLNVQPTADFHFSIDETNDNRITARLSNPTDPSQADTDAGFKYSFATSPDQLADNAGDASSTPYATFDYAPGTVIYGRVFDKDSGYSDFSSADALLPTINAPQATPLGVTLAWLDVTGGQAQRWRVRRSDDGVNYSDWHITMNNPDATSLVDNTVEPGKTYYYIVRGLGAADDPAHTGQTPFSLAIQVTVPPLPAPTAVTPTVNADHTIQVNWALPNGADPSWYQGFKIDVYDPDETITADSTPITSYIAKGSSRSQTFADLEHTGRYQFVVSGLTHTSFNADGSLSTYSGGGAPSTPLTSDPEAGWHWISIFDNSGNLIDGITQESIPPSVYLGPEWRGDRFLNLPEHDKVRVGVGVEWDLDDPNSHITAPEDAHLLAKVNGWSLASEPLQQNGTDGWVDLNADWNQTLHPAGTPDYLAINSPSLAVIYTPYDLPDANPPLTGGASWYGRDPYYDIQLFVPPGPLRPSNDTPGGGLFPNGPGGGPVPHPPIPGPNPGPTSPPPSPPPPGGNDGSNGSTENTVNLVIGSFDGFDSKYGYPYGSDDGTINRYGWSVSQADPGHLPYGWYDEQGRHEGPIPDPTDSTFIPVNDGYDDGNIDEDGDPVPNNVPDFEGELRPDLNDAGMYVDLTSTTDGTSDGSLTLNWDNAKIQLFAPDGNDGWIALSGNSYTLNSIPWEGSSGSEYCDGIPFIVKGIAASTSLNDEVVTATFTKGDAGAAKDNAAFTVGSAELGINAGDDAKPGELKPDADWKIDSADDQVKNTGDGFSFWWSRDGNGSLSKMGLTDLAPFMVDLSKFPAAPSDNGHKFRFRLEGGGSALQKLIIYNAASPADDRLKFLSDMPTAVQQLSEANWSVSPSAPSDPITSASGKQEFVLRAITSGNVATAKASTTLILEVSDGNGHWIAADKVRLTIRPAEDYWSMWSTRGPADVSYAYPTEDNRTATVNIFRPAHYVADGSGSRLPDTLDNQATADPNRQIVVFVHGFNVSQANAEASADEFYKRLYWTGFRGQLVDFNWQGDDAAPLFDPNVLNAFKTAPQLMNFLHDKVNAWTGNHPEHVNIIGHSLGALVMWEALRLNKALGLSPVVHNVTDVEAAIWSEAFEPQTDLTYPSGNYTVGGDSDDPITYTVEQQKHDSWRFWFRQKDESTNTELDIRQNLAGSQPQVIHSYNPNDFALRDLMRINDATLRHDQYNRDQFHTGYRTIADFSNDSLQQIPALMSQRTSSLFDYNSLNLPAGAMPLGYVNSADNVEADQFGWYPTSHSHFLGSADKMSDASLPTIWAWYQKVFRELGAIPIGNT